MMFLRKTNMAPDRVWLNNKYQVLEREFDAADGKGGTFTMIHLSIKRRDKDTIHDWRDLQRIKNELLGDDIEAAELYPAEERRVDTANQYHLWALPKGMAFPFGFWERLVVGGHDADSKQRDFDCAPEDVIDTEEWTEKLAASTREESQKKS